jgi:hypothetical protein
MEFPDERAAARFEKYLKSGFGLAFAKRHFGLDSTFQSLQLDSPGAATMREGK